MERWLSFELSARLGVLANAERPFPRHLLSRMLDAVLGEQPAAAAAFTEQAMTLSIAALLLGERLADTDERRGEGRRRAVLHSGGTVLAPQSGTLYLGSNDNSAECIHGKRGSWFRDNSGTIRVALEIRRKTE